MATSLLPRAKLALLCALAMLGTTFRSLAAENAPPDLLAVVRGSVDALIEHGRDHWGTERTAMIVSILDRNTLAPPEKMPRGAAGVRETDRTTRFGCNTNLQQNLYQTMFVLSEVTGDKKYAQVAEAALVDFVRHTQSPVTDLLGWGEHLCYDLSDDRVASAAVEGKPYAMYHEMKRKLAFWELLYEREPERMLRFARGLWEHQIADHKTGDFSRHAHWEKHKPGRGFDFTKEGGYMIDVWSKAFAASGDDVFRQVTTVLASRYRGKVNDRHLLDYDATRKNYCNNGHNITLAKECHDAAPRFGSESDPTYKLLRDLAGEIDRGFLACHHVPADPQRGYIATCMTDSGEPRDREGPGPGGYTVLWGMGYGKQSTAMVGLHVYHRFRQLPEGDQRQAYRRLFLDGAAAYRDLKVPGRADDIDIWAVEPALAIFLELAAFRETGEQAYLDSAQRLAEEAITTFWRETSPLPKASLLAGQYEAVCCSDTLLLALLAVHAETHKRPPVAISELDK